MERSVLFLPADGAVPPLWKFHSFKKSKCDTIRKRSVAWHSRVYIKTVCIYHQSEAENTKWLQDPGRHPARLSRSTAWMHTRTHTDTGEVSGRVCLNESKADWTGVAPIRHKSDSQTLCAKPPCPGHLQTTHCLLLPAHYSVCMRTYDTLHPWVFDLCPVKRLTHRHELINTFLV